MVTSKFSNSNNHHSQTVFCLLFVPNLFLRKTYDMISEP